MQKMNTGPCAPNPPNCYGLTAEVDKNVATDGKLVFERQGEFARELLCFMFDTGAMADVEVVTFDCGSIRSHAEVLVRVSGYFRRTLLGGDRIFTARRYALSWP